MTTKLSPTMHWKDEVDVTVVGFAIDAPSVHRVAGGWGQQIAGHWCTGGALLTANTSGAATEPDWQNYQKMV